jgi:cardiolipin synthase
MFKVPHFLSLATAVALLTGCGSPAASLSVATSQPVAAAPAPTITVTSNADLDQDSLAAPLPRMEEEVAPPTPIAEPAPEAGGNAASLYVSPEETLPAVKRLINEAQHSLYLETFNFGTSYARQIVPLLAAKAKSGVEVKLLVDFLGSRFLKGYDGYVKQLKDAGVTVLTYNPRFFGDANGAFTFNITHRKLYMADGTVAMTGGVNLMGGFDTTTQDVLIAWRGPVLGPLYHEFAHDWSLAGGGKLAQEPDLTPQGAVNAQVVVTSPDEGRYEIRDAVFKAIDGAEHEILIQQQYFWDEKLIEHLHAAVKRGVKLRVLVPGGEQKLIQKTCNSDQLAKLVAEGAEARRYRGPSGNAHLHTKYFAVDDRWVIDGSCNGDTRSLVDNQELDVITTDPTLIKDLRERLFEQDWAHFSEPFVAPKAPPAFEQPFHTVLDAVDYYL